MYSFSFLPAPAQTTHRQWHCDHRVSRTWCITVHSKEYSLSFSTCVYPSPRVWTLYTQHKISVSCGKCLSQYKGWLFPYRQNNFLLAIKNSLVHLKELLKLYIKLCLVCYRLFMSCLVFKIFRPKKVSCSPFWIIEDMHVTTSELNLFTWNDNIQSFGS
jgi:hypothetical protein